jgi:cyclophilin family peptidyl-prolyl cis-trans isomerase
VIALRARSARGCRVAFDRFVATSVLAAFGAAIGCGGAPAPSSKRPAGANVEPAIPLPEPRAASLQPDVTERVEIVTNRGRIVVGLYGEAAPVTVANFLSYVDAGFYDGKIFHRVLPAFMIQAGGFDEALERGATESPVRLEIIPGLEHLPGIVSMARVASEPNSATSQFFICVAQAPQLNGGYAAFGKVEEGYEVAMDISNVRTHGVQTNRGAMDDVPVTPVVIEALRRLPTR